MPAKPTISVKEKLPGSGWNINWHATKKFGEIQATYSLKGKLT